MEFELDHIFILTSPGAPAANALSTHLTEGEKNTHPGQGTSCRRFFFNSNYLELLYVDNPADAQSDLTRPTHLYPRWLARNTTCPFGLILRSTTSAPTTPSFPTFQYNPTYLPPNLSLHIATNAAELNEPLFTFLPLCRTSPPLASAPHLTAAHFHGPWPSNPSDAFAAVSTLPILKFHQAPAYHLELAFEQHSRQAIDLRPSLPLIVHI